LHAVVPETARRLCGIVTMYHDQGQITMKRMGFERGVTVQGGLPIPITTPAHGMAYDIAGLGKANIGAMRNAFALAVRMGAAHRDGFSQ
jgi:4-hydroxythreonine-4-phosphate dehydrogenase